MKNVKKQAYNAGIDVTVSRIGVKDNILAVKGLDCAKIVYDYNEVKLAIALNKNGYNSNGPGGMPTIVKVVVQSHGDRKLEWSLYYSIEHTRHFYYLNFLGSIALFNNVDDAVLDKYYLPKIDYRNGY